MKYNYSLASDFQTNDPDLNKLKSEIENTFIVKNLISITEKLGIITIEFDTSLAPEELTQLDVLVSLAEPLPTIDFIHETIMLAATDTQVNNRQDWQDFGGVIVSPTHLNGSTGWIKAQITGQYRVEGDGAEVSLLEEGDWNMQAAQELIDPPQPLPTTGGMWLPFTAYSNTEVRSGFWAYILRARKGQANNFYLRYLTLALVEERDG